MTDRLGDALASMRPEVGPDETDQALASVHSASARRRRHRTVVRSALGAAAAASLLAGVVALAGGRDDEARQVVVDQPSETTLPPWVITSLPGPTTATTEPPVVRSLDDLHLGVVGIELTTWGGAAEEWRGLWRADEDLTNRVVVALEGGRSPDLEPERMGWATMRLELADESVVVARVDLETGLVEPGRSIGPQLARELRHAFDDAVASPWARVEPHDDSYLNVVLAQAGGPWPSPEAAVDALVDAAREVERARLEDWFGEDYEVEEGYDPLRGELVGDRLILLRNIDGDDSTRGPHYRLWLLYEPDGWFVDHAEWRWLCQRSIPQPPDHLCA
jgi:hypothetical protein